MRPNQGQAGVRDLQDGHLEDNLAQRDMMMALLKEWSNNLHWKKEVRQSTY
jgi:hypothetical protein